MVVRGRVSGGVVVLDDANALPEGALVRVERLESAEAGQPAARGGAPGTAAGRGESRAGRKETVFDRLLGLAGILEGGPPDLARNHDHYLHGRPRS